MRPIKAALFDLDGTLFDSMDIWNQIDINFLSARGFAVPQDYLSAISVLSFRQAAEYTITRFHLNESPENVLAEWFDMASKAYAEVELKKGALKYVQQLYGAGTTIVTATALAPALAVPALAHTGLSAFISHQFQTEEVGCSKENPAFFHQVAGQLALEPTQCALFEDLLPCVQGAKQAGIYTVAVEDSHCPDSEALKQIADCYITSFDKAPFPLINPKE